jgi:hypothetical protein
LMSGTGRDNMVLIVELESTDDARRSDCVHNCAHMLRFTLCCRYPTASSTQLRRWRTVSPIVTCIYHTQYIFAHMANIFRGTQVL